jgi:hypothetical protein
MLSLSKHGAAWPLRAILRQAQDDTTLLLFPHQLNVTSQYHHNQQFALLDKVYIYL